jgi:hypothetical protein
MLKLTATGLCGASAAAMIATTALAQTVTLHRLDENGRCGDPKAAPMETIDLTPGQIVITSEILGYRHSNFTGIPQWRSFRSYDPARKEYTGWVEYLQASVDGSVLQNSADSKMIPPKGPAEGGKMNLVETYAIFKPVRIQIRLDAPHIYYGDGSCEQFAMEHSLSVTGVARSAGGDANTPARPRQTGLPPGSSWSVVEDKPDTRESWAATWTVLADGRSFDANWTHTPGGDKGKDINFARIESIDGSMIIIDRPGLGKYTGTIGTGGRMISGGQSWCRTCTWTVTFYSSMPASLH